MTLLHFYQELLDNVSNYAQKYLTGDEIWEYGYELEAKAQSSQ